MRHFSVDIATYSSRSQDNRRINVPYLPNLFGHRRGQCSGLRAAGPSSEIKVFDSTTLKLKRIESPNGEVIEVF